MKFEADDFNLNDKVENYTLCMNDGKKMWKKTFEELTEDPYILGENNKTLPPQIKKESFYSQINGNLPTVKKTRGISNYHQFIKEKIIEFTNTYPNLTKKDRYSLVLSEWKKTKNDIQ